MSHSLPSAPNLEHLKKQAKALRKAVRAQEPAALSRMEAQPGSTSGADVCLANVQFVIAREYGFPSWPRLKAYVQSLAANPSMRRPLSTDVEWFDDRASGLVSSHQDAIPTTLAQLREFHPRFASLPDEAIRQAEFTLADAKIAVAREHGFETWRQFVNHLRALAAGETVEPFLTAFEAVKSGDLPGLEKLLAQDYSLANAPGTNGNTLLNLAVSCKQPGAVEILLAAGAEVDRANKYGGTPLHQAAYSNQLELAQRLIASGDSLHLSARGDGGTPLVWALFWGHHALADSLAQHGVFPCNLRVAAGLGRLDLLETFFDAEGHLTPEAGLHRLFYRPHPGFPTWTPSDDPQEIIDEALVYASKNGMVNALRFLLDHGADVNSEPYNGTALHWAASEGQAEVVQWLLDHGAAVDGRAQFGGQADLTPLHCAAWGGQLSAVQCLVQNGADATLRESEFHSSPIGWADHGGHEQVRDFLLDHTPFDLHDAIRFGRVDRALEILEADPAAASRPLYLPTERISPHAAPRLPLYRAIHSNRVELAERLLQCGAEPNPMPPEQGRSPLSLALHLGQPEMAEVLRRYGGRE